MQLVGRFPFGRGDGSVSVGEGGGKKVVCGNYVGVGGIDHVKEM